jgi:glycosyltransferase involved in cell wall biosynthesis
MTMPVKSSPQNTQQTRDKTTIPDPDRHIPSHIALFMPSLGGGGVERVMLNLAGAFVERGSRVDLLVCRAEGPYQDRLPAQLNIVALRAALPGWARLLILAADPKGLQPLLWPVLLPPKGAKQFRYLPDLARYLRREHPQVLLSALTKPNLMAVWARRLAGAPTRLVISEHSTLSPNLSVPRRKWKWRWRFFPSLGQRVYPGADAIIAVSNGVADDLAQSASIPRERITTIYNPIVSPTLVSQSKAPLDHPWFQPSAPPVVLAVGRLCEQKDFPTLLRAFARVRARQEAHLMVLGEADAKRGKLRTDLMALATQLGIADDVALPGFVANPFAFMARAAVFVLSSVWEGLPSVLIEALACGCPVVSTNCLGGPAEILANGEYGPLVPMGDDTALADAILSVLSTPPDRNRLRARAARFSVDYAADRYLEVLLGAT